MKGSVGKMHRPLRIAGAVVLVFLTFLPATVHPASSSQTRQQIGMIVPLYSYPTNPIWTTLIQAKETQPSVPVIAVINPDSGPGSSYDPNYASGIQSLQS